MTSTAWAPEVAGAELTMATSKRPPLSPEEGCISDDRQVQHFRPVCCDRWSQTRELTEEEAIGLWQQKRQQGWQVCSPQWVTQASLSPR